MTDYRDRTGKYRRENVIDKHGGKLAIAGSALATAGLAYANRRSLGRMLRKGSDAVDAAKQWVAKRDAAGAAAEQAELARRELKKKARKRASEESLNAVTRVVDSTKAPRSGMEKSVRGRFMPVAPIRMTPMQRARIAGRKTARKAWATGKQVVGYVHGAAEETTRRAKIGIRNRRANKRGLPGPGAESTMLAAREMLREFARQRNPDGTFGMEDGQQVINPNALAKAYLMRKKKRKQVAELPVEKRRPQLPAKSAVVAPTGEVHKASEFSTAITPWSPQPQRQAGVIDVDAETVSQKRIRNKKTTEAMRSKQKRRIAETMSGKLQRRIENAQNRALLRGSNAASAILNTRAKSGEPLNMDYAKIQAERMRAASGSHRRASRVAERFRHNTKALRWGVGAAIPLAAAGIAASESKPFQKRLNDQVEKNKKLKSKRDLKRLADSMPGAVVGGGLLGGYGAIYGASALKAARQGRPTTAGLRAAMAALLGTSGARIISAQAKISAEAKKELERRKSKKSEFGVIDKGVTWAGKNIASGVVSAVPAAMVWDETTRQYRRVREGEKPKRPKRKMRVKKEPGSDAPQQQFSESETKAANLRRMRAMVQGGIAKNRAAGLAETGVGVAATGAAGYGLHRALRAKRKIPAYLAGVLTAGAGGATLVNSINRRMKGDFMRKMDRKMADKQAKAEFSSITWNDTEGDIAAAKQRKHRERAMRYGGAASTIGTLGGTALLVQQVREPYERFIKRQGSKNWNVVEGNTVKNRIAHSMKKNPRAYAIGSVAAPVAVLGAAALGHEVRANKHEKDKLKFRRAANDLRRERNAGRKG
ncbi:hypothetical protein EBZ80_12975 [bacterium]|nr:hypothetical protein [bacterium]